jgi:hypothetical protein
VSKPFAVDQIVAGAAGELVVAILAVELVVAGAAARTSAPFRKSSLPLPPKMMSSPCRR